MRSLSKVLVTVLCMAAVAGAQPPPAEHRVLVQAAAPVAITEYTARYQARSSARSEGIRHTLSYRNAADRKIVVVQFGLLAFNIFNEFQDRLGGFTIEDIDVGETEDGAWVANALAESAFYTGVAYVSKVRFKDGEIWTADNEEVLTQLQEIEEDLNIDALEQ